MKRSFSLRPATTLFATLLVGLALGVFVGRIRQPKPPVPANGFTFFNPLIDIRNQIRRHYVKTVSDKTLLHGAIRGMMGELDPYSTYFSPRQWKQFDQETHGKFSGIGAKLAQEGKHGPVVVISPLENSPALKAGMLPGDRVLSIDGKSLAHRPLKSLEMLLSGPPGTKVDMRVVHAGGHRPVTLRITRQVITLHSVKGFRRHRNGAWDFWIDHRRRIAYVRISSFMSGTAGEMDKALLPLIHGRRGVRGIVLDLRFDPGGLLTSAISVAGRFLRGGVIVTTRGRNGRNKFVARATPQFTYPPIPVVVLINQYSASASEIVAGALKDHHRALLIGTRTFGKGSVQNLITLEGGRSAIKLTTAYYYLPNGRNIMRTKNAKVWGVDPSTGFAVPMTNAQNRALLEARAESDIIVPPGGRGKPTASVAKAGAGTDDPQMQRALQTLLAQQIFTGAKPVPVVTTQPSVSASLPGARRR